LSPRPYVRLTSGHDHSKQDGEQSDRGRFVEKRLALDKSGQPCRRADVAEDGNHRSGVGGGHDRAKQQANHQRNAASDHSAKPIEAVVIRVATIASKRIGAASPASAAHRWRFRPEHQQWQKDVDEGSGADRQLDKGVGKGIGLRDPAQPRHDGRKAAQSQPDHADENRHLRISGERLAKTDDHQQRRNNNQHESDVDHPRLQLLSPKKASRSDSLF
jgi:hypothetical protein